MSPNLNYSGFVDMFIDSDDDFEPYGVVSESKDEMDVSGSVNLSSEFKISSLYDT